MAFFDSSKKVADRYLQNIVFVDERAYKESDNQQHAFNAKTVSDAFARKQKLSTVFAPSSEEELNDCLPMLLKADVIVLDWSMDFQDMTSAGVDDVDDTEDEEQDDTRGKHTLTLIDRIVEDAGKDKIRLIVVYTGETNLSGITDTIYSKREEGIFAKDTCKVSSQNICILIRAKENGGGVQYRHLSELQAMVWSYENLPDLILEEFTRMVYGLLPNYALGAINTIRESTSKMLGVFSKDLDAAYLGHLVAIPDKEDGARLLAEIFGTSIKELLEDSRLIENGWVDEWIDEQVPDGGRQITIKNAVTLTKEKVHKFWSSDKTELKEKFNEAFGESVKQEDIILDRATGVFADGAEKKNMQFAVLTQMRNTFGPSSAPKKLSQGTIVKTGDSYYVCLQPRCDSGRISAKKDGERLARPFLFLPLSETGRGIAAVVDEKTLKVDNTSHRIQSFSFAPENGDSDIVFKEQDGVLCVNDQAGIHFVWKGELKELQAQRVNMNYSNELSRVGLDESEWLRLKSGK